MGIAIDFTTTTESTTRSTSLLIPELIYEIERYLEIQDLAAAALVCRAWHEAWSSSLYSTVRCHIRRTSAPLGVHSSSLDPTRKTAFHSFAAAPPARDNYQGYVQHRYYSLQQQHLHLQHGQHQQYIPPFLNFQKYGRWIRNLEVSNLYCLPSVPLLRSTGGAAVSSHTSPSSSSSAFSPASLSLPPPVQDHLSQIQTCWHLTQLDISRTVMSLERLDDLLSSLPRLKVFKFEVVNKTEIATANGLHGVSGGSNGGGGGGSPGSGFRRGYMQQQPSSFLLKKPKQVTLEGLEPEVIRVIARRLGGQLERLDLVFTVTGRIGLSTFLELLGNCRTTLKSLALTRAEVYQTDYSRERHAAIEISALLASLLGTTSATTTSSSPSTSSTTSSPSSPSSSSSSSPSLPPTLEYLSFNSCVIPDREFEWFLRHAPQLKELNLHDCRLLTKPAVAAILQHSPLLESLSLRSVPYVDADALKQLFETIPRSSATATTAFASHQAAGSHAPGTTATTSSGVNGSGGAASTSTASKETTGLRLKSIRLAYLRQLNDTVMETIARYQGACLEKLSVQWCPHVTDVGILPIFMYCQRLQDLSLYLSKPTLNIFKDLTDEPFNGVNATGAATGTATVPATTTPATATAAAVKRRLWACASTLERLEVGGQMFVDRIRSSSEHLQPQLYHHLSPNPHHMRSPSGNQDLTLGGHGGTGGTNTTNNGGPANATNITAGINNSNVIHDPYSIAHYQGYPMYHLWRYHRLSDPFRELQAQLETLPRLKHLGVQAKGIEHLLRRGFGPNVHIQSLALLNQQGRVWSPEEIREMFEHMPHLRTLVCEKSTIMAGGSQGGGIGGGVVSGGGCGGQWKGVDLLKRQMRMRRILEDHHVELVQSTLSPMTI